MSKNADPREDTCNLYYQEIMSLYPEDTTAIYEETKWHSLSLLRNPLGESVSLCMLKGVDSHFLKVLHCHVTQHEQKFRKHVFSRLHATWRTYVLSVILISM